MQLDKSAVSGLAHISEVLDGAVKVAARICPAPDRGFFKQPADCIYGD